MIHADDATENLYVQNTEIRVFATSIGERERCQQFADFDRIQVVDGENRASLIFVAQKAKPFRLPCVFVANQVDVDDFTIPATK